MLVYPLVVWTRLPLRDDLLHRLQPLKTRAGTPGRWSLLEHCLKCAIDYSTCYPQKRTHIRWLIAGPGLDPAPSPTGVPFSPSTFFAFFCQ